MSGRLSDAWLEELRSRVSLEEVVSEYVPLKQKGRRFWGCCPFHNEKTPSFSVDSESQLYYCFGCHKGGTVINFVMDMERMEFMDAVRLLADRAHMEVPARSRRPGDSAASREERDRLYEVNRTAARYFHDLLWTQDGAEALNYLYGRGLNDSDIRRFGLGAWWLLLALAAVAIVAGSLLIACPFQDTPALIRAMGLSLLAQGLLSVCVALCAIRIPTCQRLNAVA